MTRGGFAARLAGIVLAAIGVLVGAGCAAVAPAPTPTIAAIETFPPPWIVEPDLYDANHCLVPPPGEPIRECLPESPEPAWAADPNDPGSVVGFNGPSGDAVGGYVRILRANAVVLLLETITVSKVGPWHALGLVRNETPTNAGALRVRAVLRGRDGSLPDLSSGPALIDPLRPGEPAPFELSSAVDASEVAAVEWSVEVGAPDAAPRLRSFAIGVDWSVPYGDRDRLTWGDEWPGWPPDPKAPPYPFT